MNEEQRKAGTINILAERDRKAEKDYSRDFHIDEKYKGMGKGRT